MYMEKNKEKLTREFSIHWSSVENNVSPKKHLLKYYKLCSIKLEKIETQTYHDEMEKETQIEHDSASHEWKKKIETFHGTPLEFERLDNC